VNSTGITPKKPGFKKIPARMYPVTFGRPTSLASSPPIKPANRMRPNNKVVSIVCCNKYGKNFFNVFNKLNY